MSSTHHISQEDLALYSMQALTPAENAEVKAHLDSCASCRNALVETLGDVALIGLSAPQQDVSAQARQRFLAALQNTPQVAGTNTRPTPAPTPVHHKHGSALGWFEWIITAAALVVACYLGYHNFKLQRELNESRGEIAQLSVQAARAQDLQRLMDALTSPDAKQVTLTETKRPAQPAGHATYLWKSGTLIFVANNLRPVPQSKTYELWLIPMNGKAPMPAGLFRPDASGSASVVMPDLPEGVEAKAFGVTVEEAAGSQTPTLPIVMSGQ